MFCLVFCGLIFINWLLNIIFSLKSEKKEWKVYAQIIHLIILASNPIFHIKKIIVSEVHKFNLKLCDKQGVKIDFCARLWEPS